jgi:hypothetical protein
MRYVVGIVSEGAGTVAQALLDRLVKLPAEGIDVGGGRHVTHSPAPPGPGWTSHFADVRKHPDRNEWAVPVLDPATFANLSHLSGVEITLLTNRFAASVELDASWFAE